MTVRFPPQTFVTECLASSRGARGNAVTGTDVRFFVLLDWLIASSVSSATSVVVLTLIDPMGTFSSSHVLDLVVLTELSGVIFPYPEFFPFIVC